MKKLLLKALVGVLLLHVTGCRASVELDIQDWERPPILEEIQKASESERIIYYNQHGIDVSRCVLKAFDINDIFLPQTSFDVFTTYAEPKTYYLYKGYLPTIRQIYPESEALLEEATFYQFAQDATHWSFVTVAFVNPLVLFATLFSTQSREEAFGALSTFGWVSLAAILVTTIAKMVFSSEECNRYFQIKEGYNEALRKYLDLSPDSLSRVIPEPTLAIK